MTRSVTCLPDDIWAIILALLDVSDLRRFQAVSRTFLALTKALCELRLELDAAGYAEPQNSRSDISPEEKLNLLREHVARRNSLVPSQVVRFWEDQLHVDGGSGSPSTRLRRDPVFVGGVLARCGYVDDAAEDGTTRRTQRIDVAQLPSVNKGTELRQWSVHEHMFRIRDFWIEPDYDLLVLFERPPMPWNDEDSGDSGCYDHFHLRTLSSNTQHPKVHMPKLSIIRNTLGRLDEGFAVQFVGPLMLVLREYYQGIVVWDWTTGEIMLEEKLNRPCGLGVSILSDEWIALPRSRSNEDPSHLPLGFVDVYSLYPADRKSMKLTHLVSLGLPAANTAPVLPESSRNLYDVTRVEVTLRTQPTHQPTNDPLRTVRPAKIFEVSKLNQILQLDLHFMLENLQPSRTPYMKVSRSSLFIPAGIILQQVPRIQVDGAGSQVIPWFEWGTEARWIHGLRLGEHSYGATVSGSRCIFTHFSPCCSKHRGVKCVHGHSYEIPVLDFHPAAARKHDQPPPFKQHDRLDKSRFVLRIWTCQPSESHWTLGEEEWVHDRNRTVRPYRLTRFKHDTVKNLLDERYSTAWIDNEHLLIIHRESNISKSLMAVTVITF